MAHKVHPKIFRIKEIADWDSRGFYKKPADYLEEDFKIREFLKEKIGKFAVEKIEIERFSGKINIIISSARPGLIIGRGGEGVEALKREILKILKNKTQHIYFRKEDTQKAQKNSDKVLPKKHEISEKEKEVRIEIREIKDPWSSAGLASQWVSQQIEKRMPHRKILKQALGKIMAHKEIKGARIEVSGRLGGNEIARREWLAQGQLPRQTLRADLDYALSEAHCAYGAIGIKVWIYKGEKFE